LEIAKICEKTHHFIFHNTFYNNGLFKQNDAKYFSYVKNRLGSFFTVYTVFFDFFTKSVAKKVQA